MLTPTEIQATATELSQSLTTEALKVVFTKYGTSAAVLAEVLQIVVTAFGISFAFVEAEMNQLGVPREMTTKIIDGLRALEAKEHKSVFKKEAGK